VTIPDHIDAEMSPRVILIDDDKDFLDAQVSAKTAMSVAARADLRASFNELYMVSVHPEIDAGSEVTIMPGEGCCNFRKR
jgi:hypothetical protein